MKFIMNFLRSPFQFRSSEQPSREVESSSPIVENMFIDPTTGLTTETRWRTASPGIGASSSIAGSPRLQHRVPGFGNNGNHPIEVVHEPSVPQGVSSENSEKSHRVRVVPIKVGSVDDSGTPKKRSSAAFHSSSGSVPRSSQFGPLHPNFEDLNNRKRHSSGPPVHRKSDVTESKSKVCNIPIFVEGRDTPVVPKTSQSSQNVPVDNIPSPNAQSVVVKQNGGSLAKCSAKSKCKQDAKQNVCDISLKQISDILAELQPLKTAVDEFRGVPQGKQYRFLDEMLTRCMLKLDNVETHGNDEVRASRKAAIKAVQECINDLESHAQANTKLNQLSEKVDETGEKCGSPDITDAKKEEICVPKGIDLPICENTQEETESVNETEDPEQSTTKETEDSHLKPLCLEGTDLIASKPSEPLEVTGLAAGPVEMTIAKDENKNFKEAEDMMNKPTEVEEVKTATDKLEEQVEKAQVWDQPINMAEELKTSKELVGTSCEPVESVEVIVNNNFVEIDTVNNPVEMEEIEVATNKQQEPEEKAQVQDQPIDMVEVEEFKTSAVLVETGKDHPVDSVEVTDVRSHGVSPPGDFSEQNEPMDSEVRDEAKVDSEMVGVNNELVDSEMVELAKMPVTSESNKDSSVSSEING